MKTLITLLLASVTCTAVQAQGYFRYGYFQNWDTIASTWDDYQRITVEMDEEGGMTLSLTSDTLDGTDWTHNGRSEITYNVDSNPTQVLGLLWDGAQAQWVNDELTVNTYNASGLKTELLVSQWDGTAWVQQGKWVSTYDVNNYESETIELGWTTEWDTVDRTLFTRDSNGNPVVEVTDQYNQGVWTNYSIDSSTFNAQNLEVLSDDWFNYFGSYILAGRTEWSYDAQGHIDTIWTSAGGLGSEPILYQLETRDDAGGGFQNQTYQWNTSFPSIPPTWRNNFRLIWDPSTQGIASQLKPDFQVLPFPNPTSGQFTLALDGISGAVEVALFNMTGQQVATTHQFDAGNPITMDASGLANGTYIVRWKAGERTGRTLLTVQH